MKIFIHIGTHKTGSTHIQNTCKSLREKLNQQGVCYPVKGYSQSGHHELAWAMMNNDKEKTERFVNAAIKEAKGCTAILISSEEFEFVRNFEVFSEVFSPHEVEVIAYFRRQDKYLESEYNQHVKMYENRFSGDIYKFFMYHDFFTRFKYDELIEKWGKTQVISKFHIKSYDLESSRNNLLGAFAECIGLDDNIFIQEGVKRANISIPPRDIIYIARLNSEEGVTREDHEKFLRFLVKNNKSLERNYGVGEKFLNNLYSRRLFGRFDKSNKILSERYCSGEPLFKMNFDQCRKTVIDYHGDFDPEFYFWLKRESGVSE